MSNTWQSVETALFPIVSSINQYLSNYILVFLLLSVGIWYVSALIFHYAAYYLTAVVQLFHLQKVDY